MNFEETRESLLSYIEANNIYRIFLPLAEILLIGGAVCTFFFGDPSLINTIAFFAFYAGLIVTLAKGNYKMLTVGLLIKCIIHLLWLLGGLFSFQMLSQLINLAIWGWFLYLSFKKYKNI